VVSSPPAVPADMSLSPWLWLFSLVFVSSTTLQASRAEDIQAAASEDVIAEQPQTVNGESGATASAAGKPGLSSSEVDEESDHPDRAAGEHVDEEEVDQEQDEVEDDPGDEQEKTGMPKEFSMGTGELDDVDADLTEQQRKQRMRSCHLNSLGVPSRIKALGHEQPEAMDMFSKMSPEEIQVMIVHTTMRCYLNLFENLQQKLDAGESAEEIDVDGGISQASQRQWQLLKEVMQEDFGLDDLGEHSLLNRIREIAPPWFGLFMCVSFLTVFFAGSIVVVIYLSRAPAGKSKIKVGGKVGGKDDKKKRR